MENTGKRLDIPPKSLLDVPLIEATLRSVEKRGIKKTIEILQYEPKDGIDEIIQIACDLFGTTYYQVNEDCKKLTLKSGKDTSSPTLSVIAAVSFVLTLKPEFNATNGKVAKIFFGEQSPPSKSILIHRIVNRVSREDMRFPAIRKAVEVMPQFYEKVKQDLNLNPKKN